MKTRRHYLISLLVPIILFLFLCNVSLAQSCPKNMYFNKQKNSCDCDQYTYWDGTGCVYCPAGQTYNGTDCVPIECPENMHFDKDANACACDKYTYWDGDGCVYCPEGQSYNGTDCVPIECPPNMYFDTNPDDPGYNTCRCIAGTTYTTGPGCV